MTDDASNTVRVCLTRCPLPPPEKQVHSLPCRIHFDGLAAVKKFFLPQSSDGNCNSTDHGGSNAEEQDVKMQQDTKDNDNMMYAAFRGIQLQGEKLLLAPMGFTGLVLEDSGLRHPKDEGRIWEVEDHFNELTWWNVPKHTTKEMQQLPVVLQQWHNLSAASDACVVSVAFETRNAQTLKLATRHKALELMMLALRACVRNVVTKLVLLPIVGVSLCSAVVIMLGLQWMEALQRQHQTLKWRACMWTTLSTLLPTLLPPKRPETVVMPADKSLRSSQADIGRSEFLDRGDTKDAANDGKDDESYDSWPLKRQKAVTGGREQTGSTELEARQDDDQKDEEEVGDEENEEDDNDETIGEQRKKKWVMEPRVQKRVFIWDLDETLLLFASLYTGTFAQTHGKEVAPGVALGEQMMSFLLTMLERHFFFSDLYDTDVDHIANVASTTKKKDTACLKQNNAPEHQRNEQERYERIREIYERRGHVDFLHDANSEWYIIRGTLIAAIDKFSTGWLNEAREVLELIVESAVQSTQPNACPDTAASYVRNEDVENVNVLVTNTQLVPALCKCLIYQLDSFFPIDCVYSSAKVHKYRCFETILKKYDAPDVEFIAIGDGLEEEHVSLALGLEFHKIQSIVDLKRLRYDLQLVQANSSSASVIDSPAVVAVQISVASSSFGQTAVV